MNKIFFENQKKKDVIYFKNSLVKINKKDLDLLKKFSNHNRDKNTRYCNHKSKNARLHEMIIFHKKGYYVGLILILIVWISPFNKGKVDIVIFDKKGNISDIIKMKL